jgi:hypothetical protein
MILSDTWKIQAYHALMKHEITVITIVIGN